MSRPEPIRDVPGRRWVRACLRKACSQHLWRPVPPDLEDEVVDVACSHLDAADVDASPYGALFEIAVEMAKSRQGYGAFATIYDEEVLVRDEAHPEAFDDGLPGTYRAIRKRPAEM